MHQPGHPAASATNSNMIFSQNQLFVVEWHEEPLRLHMLVERDFKHVAPVVVVVVVVEVVVVGVEVAVVVVLVVVVAVAVVVVIVVLVAVVVAVVVAGVAVGTVA